VKKRKTVTVKTVKTLRDTSHLMFLLKKLSVFVVFF